MYELIKVTENCYYIQCPAKIGIIKTGEKEVCLIDSGNNKDAGKRALKIFEANEWRLKAIYNTHSHADHIGGNELLQSRTGCEIYAPTIESDFTNHPILEPSFLYGGNPPKELKHKFLLADKSECQYLTEDNLPDGITSVSLKGHFFDMVGFRTDEDIVFLADCLSSKETLDKYAIGFIYDVEAYLETLNEAKNMKARLFIPSHAEPCEDITELAQYNIDKVYEIGDKILDLCSSPLCFEEILKRLFDHFSLTLNFEQYALVGSALRSYLTWLKDLGKITAEFKDNMLLWKTI